MADVARTDGVTQAEWSTEEDSRLLQLLTELGPKWTRIAAMLPGRSDSSVRQRVRRLQEPPVEKAPRGRDNDLPWTSEDDKKLQRGVATYGTRWSTIMKAFFPTRTANAVRNRFHRQANSLARGTAINTSTATSTTAMQKTPTLPSLTTHILPPDSSAGPLLPLSTAELVELVHLQQVILQQQTLDPTASARLAALSSRIPPVLAQPSPPALPLQGGALPSLAVTQTDVVPQMAPCVQQFAPCPAPGGAALPRHAPMSTVTPRACVSMLSSEITALKDMPPPGGGMTSTPMPPPAPMSFESLAGEAASLVSDDMISAENIMGSLAQLSSIDDKLSQSLDQLSVSSGSNGSSFMKRPADPPRRADGPSSPLASRNSLREGVASRSLEAPLSSTERRVLASLDAEMPELSARLELRCSGSCEEAIAKAMANSESVSGSALAQAVAHSCAEVKINLPDLDSYWGLGRQSFGQAHDTDDLADLLADEGFDPNGRSRSWTHVPTHSTFRR